MRKNGRVANPTVSAGGRPDSESKLTCPGSPRHQRDRESLVSDSCSIYAASTCFLRKRLSLAQGSFLSC